MAFEESFLKGLVANIQLPQPPREDVFFNQIIQNKLLERRIEKEQEWRERILEEQKKQNELNIYRGIVEPFISLKPKNIREWEDLKNRYNKTMRIYNFQHVKPIDFEVLFPKPEPKKPPINLNDLIRGIKGITEKIKPKKNILNEIFGGSPEEDISLTESEWAYKWAREIEDLDKYK